MERIGHFALIFGMVSLVAGIFSRLFGQPLYGIESHAVIQFAEVCFLLSIAAFVSKRY